MLQCSRRANHGDLRKTPSERGTDNVGTQKQVPCGSHFFFIPNIVCALPFNGSLSLIDWTPWVLCESRHKVHSEKGRPIFQIHTVNRTATTSREKIVKAHEASHQSWRNLAKGTGYGPGEQIDTPEGDTCPNLDC